MPCGEHGLDRCRRIVAKWQTERRQQRHSVPTGGAQQPLDPDVDALGRISDPPRIASVADQVAPSGARGIRGRMRQGTLCELLEGALDVIAAIHDNDRWDVEALEARTGGKSQGCETSSFC